jgi:hypothetical protein
LDNLLGAEKEKIVIPIHWVKISEKKDSSDNKIKRAERLKVR